jgi:hypothetical protein
MSIPGQRLPMPAKLRLSFVREYSGSILLAALAAFVSFFFPLGFLVSTAETLSSVSFLNFLGPCAYFTALGLVAAAIGVITLFTLVGINYLRTPNESSTLNNTTQKIDNDDTTDNCSSEDGNFGSTQIVQAKFRRGGSLRLIPSVDRLSTTPGSSTRTSRAPSIVRNYASTDNSMTSQGQPNQGDSSARGNERSSWVNN